MGEPLGFATQAYNGAVEGSLNPEVTRTDLVAGLRDLGLTHGARVMVHSSLKSFGRVTGGARCVIDALMEVLTPQGTLLMPTFNHDVPFRAGGAGFYDPQATPTLNGVIPDTFWRMPGIYRSLDPTHPFAAWGRHARRYTELHHRTLTMGPESPLGLLLADDGVGLLLGVSYASNTFHHAVETATGAPCLGPRTECYPVQLPGGRQVMGRTWGWRQRSCPLTDRGSYGEEMQAMHLQRVTFIGGCRATLFRLRDCFDVVADLLRTGRGDRSSSDLPPCSRCSIRPRHVAQTVPSDWDPVAQRPLPDSVAWTY